MRAFRSASASVATLASLGALYVLIVLFSVLLAGRLLANPESLDLRIAGLFAIVGVLFPLGLVGAIMVSVARLARDRRLNKPGSTFKTRLLGFFALVVLLSAVPQGIMSVSFLASASRLLFRSDADEAIEGGLQIALDYYEREITQLETLAGDGTLDRALSRLAEDPARGDEIWALIRQRVPHVASLEAVSADGALLLFRGDPLFRPDGPDRTGLPALQRAAVSRHTITGQSVLRLEAPASVGRGTPIRVTLNTRLPDAFSTAARQLTRAAALFDRLNELRPTFVGVVGVVYGVFAAPIMLLAILASFFLADRILRPIELLEGATRRVADGDYSVRILTRAHDDLGALVLSFNRMVTELDRARRRMAQAEKVQAWQEIAQRLAHEVKNPLTPIRLAAERLRRRYHGEDADFADVLDRTVATIVREVEALADLLNEFRSFSRPPEPSVEPIRLAELIEEVAGVYRAQPEVEIILDEIAEELTLEVDRGQLRQVFQNLFVNATEAAGGDVEIRCRADVITRSGNSLCRIRVRDDGPGVPPDLGDRVFEPYVTSKPHGTGLGLAIVQRIIFDHDGTIGIESAPGSGTTIVMDIPLIAHPSRFPAVPPGGRTGQLG